MKRKDLEQVYWLKKELKMWQRKLADLQSDIAVSAKAVDGMPFSNTNVTSNPTEQKAIRLSETEKVIKGKIAEIQLKVAEIDKFLATIDDSYLVQIINDRCVLCLSWKEIAFDMGEMYTEEMVRQAYHRFVKKLD